MLAPDLVDRFPTLCTAPPTPTTSPGCAAPTAARSASSTPERSTAIGPQLSARELEVLSYLPTQLSAREIADALHVSLNTVKTHMQNVYRKLGCDSREAAVERARRLHLLR